MQKRLIISGKTNHSLIYGSVTVRIELHRLSYDVCAFCSRTCQKSHLIHCIKEFSVRGLKAVDLGNSARNYNAHGIRHIVFNERFGYRLCCSNGFVRLYILDIYFLFLCHFLIRHNLIILCAAALIIRLYKASPMPFI